MAPAITLSMRAVTTDVNGDGVVDPGDRVDWVISATNTGTSAVSASASAIRCSAPRRAARPTSIATRSPIAPSRPTRSLIAMPARSSTAALAAGLRPERGRGRRAAADSPLRVFSPPPPPSASRSRDERAAGAHRRRDADRVRWPVRDRRPAQPPGALTLRTPAAIESD